MRNIVFCGLCLFFVVGCSVQKEYTQASAQSDMESLCNRYELAMCGDIEIPEYTGAVLEEIIEVSESYAFVYKADEENRFDYLEGDIREGDCEDFAITFIEENLRIGNFKKGSVRMVVGKEGSERLLHMWAEITLGDVVFVVDTIYSKGIEAEDAYSGPFKYKKLYDVWRY